MKTRQTKICRSVAGILRVALCLTIPLTEIAAFAQASSYINYRFTFQGLLQSDIGAPLPDRNYRMKFVIKKSSNGSAAWTKTASSVATLNGVFSYTFEGTDDNSVVLDPSILDLPNSSPDLQPQVDVYVDTTGNGTFDESFIGIPISSVPYAFVSDRSNMAYTVANGSVGTASLSDGSVTDEKIVTMDGSKITGNISGTQISNSSVNTSALNDASITNAKLATNSVSTSKIQDRAITYDKIDVAGATSNQVLTFNSVSGKWEPRTGVNGTVTSVTASLPVLSSGGLTPNISVQTGTTMGSLVMVGAGDKLPAIDSNNLFNLDASGLGTGNVPYSRNTPNAVIADGTKLTVNANGVITNIDADTAAVSTSTDQIRGVNVTTTAPSTGHVLRYNGTSWTPSLVDLSSLAFRPVNSTGDSMSGDLLIANQHELRLGDTGTKFIALRAPSALAQNLQWTLPETNGNEGQVLKFNATTQSFYWDDVASAAAVNGPGASTNHALPRWSGSGGDTLVDSTLVVGDTGDVNGIANLHAAGKVTANGLTDTSLTSNRLLRSDGSQNLISVTTTVTDEELGYLMGTTTGLAPFVNGLTGNIQGQIDTHSSQISTINVDLTNKENSLSKGNVSAAGSIILSGSLTNAAIGSGFSIAVATADSSTNGVLSSTDWTRFDSVSSNFSGKVSKSGDSMSGALVVNANITSTGTVNAANANVSSLSANRLVFSDGSKNLASSGIAITDTELEYLVGTTTGLATLVNGLTGNIQAQLDLHTNQISTIDTDLAAKEPIISKGNISAAGSIILSGGLTNAVIGSGLSITVATANGSTNGVLSSSDWNLFNSKQGSIAEAAYLVGVTANIQDQFNADRDAIRTNSANIAANTTNIATNTSDISTINTTLGGKENTLPKGNVSASGSIVLSGSLSNAAIGSGFSIAVATAGSSTNGVLSSTDWNAFNSKQGSIAEAAYLAGITANVQNQFNTSNAAIATNTTNIATNTSDISRISTRLADASTTGLLTSNDWARFDSVSSNFSGKVSKSGDSMSGALVVNANITSTGTVSAANANLSGLSTNRLVFSDGSKNLASSGIAITDTELGYLMGTTTGLATLVNGLTGNIQAQLDTHTTQISTISTDLAAKEPAITKGNVSASGSIVLSGSLTNAAIGSGFSIAVATAGSSTNGVLSSTDWNTFNSKQGSIAEAAYLTGITANVQNQFDTSNAAIATNTANIATNSSDISRVSTTLADASTTGLLTSNDWVRFDSVSNNFSGKVSKSGDSMSGALVVDANITSTGTVNAANANVSSLSTNRLVFSDGSKNLASSGVAITDTDLGYLMGTTTGLATLVNGLTGNIQTQLDTHTTQISAISTDLAAKEPAVSKGNVAATGSIMLSGGVTNAAIGSGFSITVATANSSTNGVLSSTDWNLFNSKQGTIAEAAYLTGLTSNVQDQLNTNNAAIAANTANIVANSSDISNINTTLANKEDTFSKGNVSSAGAVILSGGLTNAAIGSGFTITVATAGGSTNGVLTSADWNLFNSKQGTIAEAAYLTGLTANVQSQFNTNNTEIAANTANIAANTTNISAINTTLAGKENTLSKGNVTGTGAVILSGGLTNAAIGSGFAITVATAGGSTNGVLTSTDWNLFNSKQGSITEAVYLTGLTTNVQDQFNTNNTAIAINTASISANTTNIATNTSDISSINTTLANKENALSKGNVSAAGSVILSGSFSNAAIGSGFTITVATANSGTNGVLSSTDWNTFNSKQGSIAEAAYLIGITANVQSQINTHSSSLSAINTTLANKENTLTKGNVSSSGAVLVSGGFANAAIGSGFTITVTTAGSSTNGVLSSTDWNTFNSKQGTIAEAAYLTGVTANIQTQLNTHNAALASKENTLSKGNVAGSGAILLSGGLTNAAIGSGFTITVSTAGSSTNGVLSSTDWNTFNSKQGTIAEAAYLTGVTANVQTQLNAHTAALASKENTLSKGNVAGSGAILLSGGLTNAAIGSGFTITVTTAGSSTSGILSSTDWNIFNSKQGTIAEAAYLTGVTANIQTQLNTHTVALASKENTLSKGNVAGSGAILLSGGLTNAAIGSGFTITVTTAGASTSGILSSTDWNTFNSKQGTIAEASYLTGVTANIQTQLNTNSAALAGKENTFSKGNVAGAGTILLSGGFTNAAIGSGFTITVSTAGSSTNGVLSSTDWNTFNGKMTRTGDSMSGNLNVGATISANAFTVPNQAGGPGALQLGDTGTHYVNIKAPTSIASNTSFTLPPTNGSSGYVLVSDGSGNTSWAAQSGTSTAVTLPTSSTTNGVPRFGNTTGNVILNSNVTIDAQNNLVGVSTFTTTGVHTLPAGSVTAPALNLGDASTGLYRPTQNQLAVAVGGTQQILVTTAAVTLGGSSGTPIKFVNSSTVSWNPGTILASSQTNTTVTVTGAAAGDTCVMNYSTTSYWTSNHLQPYCFVAAANTVTLALGNWVTGNQSPGAMSVRYTVIHY